MTDNDIKAITGTVAIYSAMTDDAHNVFDAYIDIEHIEHIDGTQSAPDWKPAYEQLPRCQQLLVLKAVDDFMTEDLTVNAVKSRARNEKKVSSFKPETMSRAACYYEDRILAAAESQESYWG